MTPHGLRGMEEVISVHHMVQRKLGHRTALQTVGAGLQPQPAELLSDHLGPAGKEEINQTQLCCGDSQGIQASTDGYPLAS